MPSDTSIVADRGLEDLVSIFMTAGDPRRAPLRRDPYPFYEQLRRAAPAYKAPNGYWLLTSYHACNSVLREPNWRKARILTSVTEPDAPGALAERVFLGSLVFQNPPAHTRLRRIISPLFTPRAIEKRRATTTAIARGLLEGLKDKDEFDFRGEFASELPVRLICQMMGISPDTREDFLMWAEMVRELQEHSRRDVSDLQYADDKARNCISFFEDLAAEKAQRPGDDIVSLLVEVNKNDAEPLTPEEFAAMLIILHVGGHSTTTDVIATGVLHLLATDRFPQLRDGGPAMVATAVDEVVRFDPPVTVATPRVSESDAEFGGITVPAGEPVYAVLAAANRDPAAFEYPNEFDIHRSPNRHLAFAAGLHHCLGVHLGKQEAQEAFRLLASEYPPLELAADPAEFEWQDSFPHRGLRELPVRWGAKR